MKKISIIIICSILFINILTMNVNAADEVCKASISSDKTELGKGDIVTINVLISNITNTAGIGQFSGILEYSDDVFELVTEEDESIKVDYPEFANYSILYSGRQDSDTTIENPWNMILVKQGTQNGFVASADTKFSDDVKPVKQGESQTVGKIKLKVKDNATATTTKITLTEMVAFELENSSSSSGNEELTGNKMSDVTLNLTIKETSANTEKPSNLNGNNTNEKNNNGNTWTGNQNNIQSPKQDDNKAKSNVPYTGIEDIIPILLIVSVISISSYVAYRKYKDI